MSLAGLDAPEVVEAHQASIADPTGWLLIKYEDGSRDRVQLLQSGTGGVNEARKGVEAYGEKSPLYGLVPFRRRRVLIKYVPEGTSRVFQVRLKVQFQSVLDALAPTDNVFEFNHASELTESALTAATMLAASNGSVSSHSSLRKKRLNNISEYGHQHQSRPGTGESATMAIDKEEIASFPRPPSSTKWDAEPEAGGQYASTGASARANLPKTKEQTDELPASALRAKALMAKRKETSYMGPASMPTAPTTGPITATKQKAVATEPIRRDQAHNALKPQSHQPSGADQKTISQWNDDVALYASIVRPKKKKLGPRPHVETSTRPGTSDLPEKSIHGRPVSNLPSSVKITNSRAPTVPSVRPKSQQSSKSLPGRSHYSATRNGTLPPLPSPVYGASVYRPESRAVPSRACSMNNEPLSNATPEKLRLMKALQIRKRNMLLSQRSSQFALEGPGVLVRGGRSDSASPSNTIQQSAQLPNIKSGSDDDCTERPELGRQASDTASPSTTTYPSEELSTQASSITSHEETPQDQHSLSSDTSSSVTAKGQASDMKKMVPSKNQIDHTSPTIIEVEQERPTEEAGPDSSTTVLSTLVPDENTANDESSTTVQSEAKEQAKEQANITDAAPTDAPEHTDKLPQPEQEPTKAESSRTATPSVPNGPKEQSDRGPKSRAPLIPPSVEQSEISDSDSLMDALQNAVVEEAMSMPVARSPATPVIHTQSFKETNRSHSHSLSRPSEASKSSTSLEKDKSPGGRSVSTALPQWPRQNTELVPLTNKSSLGSGISKRIKALEVVSSRQSSPPRDPAPAPRPVFSLFPKHSSQVTQQQTTSNARSGWSPPRKVNHSLPVDIHNPPQPLQTWRQRQEAGGVLAPPPKGETVSVTARIVRDYPDSQAGQPIESSDFMHQSPLIVEHEKPPAQRETTTTSGGMMRKGRPSLSSNTSPPHLGVPSSDSMVSKWPFGKSRHRMSRTASDNSSNAEERPRSRTGRLMKRLTNLAGPRASTRDLLAHAELEPPEAIEEDERESRVSTSESLQHVVDIGDVNVQFPDSLLWKRRFIRIDDQGSLIFSPLDNDANMRSMAHSVVLDFKDGNCIHCACESKEMQQQVLQMLVDAHSAYHQLFGN
ncbi:hypothetical protein DV736_g275, partial [Chaetothyriales sp. CBS 134916]